MGSVGAGGVVGAAIGVVGVLGGVAVGIAGATFADGSAVMPYALSACVSFEAEVAGVISSSAGSFSPASS